VLQDYFYSKFLLKPGRTSLGTEKTTKKPSRFMDFPRIYLINQIFTYYQFGGFDSSLNLDHFCCGRVGKKFDLFWPWKYTQKIDDLEL
jgi:hypothetical protein